MQRETETYRIRLIGCDDTTEFVMDITEDEAALIRRVAEKSDETSNYGCMPTMTIEMVSSGTGGPTHDR